MKNSKNKIFKLNEKFINLFDYVFNYKNFKNLKGIAKLNKILIPVTSLYFLYLLYLSIPAIYDISRLQIELPKKILNEYNIEASFSSNINYSILPSPHYIIKDVKIFNNLTQSEKEVAQIKKLKIFISQKNFFNKNNIIIKKITIQETNFLVQKKDLKFIDSFLGKKFSKNPIIIKKSNFFYKDKKNNDIVFFPISKIKLIYDEKKSKNTASGKGKIFNTPFNIN